MTDSFEDGASAAFGDSVRQALAPLQAGCDSPASTTVTWSAEHWETVEALGLPGLLVPEDAGGAGASLAEAAAAIEALGALGDPSPAAETAVLSWLVTRDTGTVPNGPLVFAEPGRRSTWPRKACTVRNGGTIDEPSGAAAGPPLLNGVPVSDPVRGTVEETPYRRAMAVTRAVQLVGAALAALDLTIGHVTHRKQFGRPLARFQAVQQHVAVAAAQTAAAAQVARTAFAALDRDDALLAASAKISAGRAGTVVAKAAHQFHGAMGYTAEYPLHRLSRSIWQWREDFGNETWWSRRLGTKICAAGPDALWAGLTTA